MKIGRGEKIPTQLSPKEKEELELKRRKDKKNLEDKDTFKKSPELEDLLAREKKE